MERLRVLCFFGFIFRDIIVRYNWNFSYFFIKIVKIYLREFIEILKRIYSSVLDRNRIFYEIYVSNV